MLTSERPEDIQLRYSSKLSELQRLEVDVSGQGCI